MITGSGRALTLCCACTAFDPGVVLMRNTAEVRNFWLAVRETLLDAQLMTKVRSTLALCRYCYVIISTSSIACCQSTWILCGWSHLDNLQDAPAVSAHVLQGLKRLRDVNAQNDGMNYRNAMGIMFSAVSERWLGPGGLVHFEQKYCISCYYDVRSLTPVEAFEHTFSP